jgi:hypothetical protein
MVYEEMMSNAPGSHQVTKLLHFLYCDGDNILYD